MGIRIKQELLVLCLGLHGLPRAFLGPVRFYYQFCGLAQMLGHNTVAGLYLRGKS